jgi:antitoxin component of MazEF toxin-antitoxin module
MSGIRIPPTIASQLDVLWQARVTAAKKGERPIVVTPAVAERWRGRLAGAQGDEEFMERNRATDKIRRDVHPAMRTLMESFLAGRVSLEEFKETFDKKTRVEWDVFGLKGPTGAMFLNQIVKNVADQDGSTDVLRHSVAVPANETDARQRLDALFSFLQKQIDDGAATPSQLRVSNIPLFLSACWHAQRPDAWPMFYLSARRALQRDGLIGQQLFGTDGYLEFASVFRELAVAVGVSFWDLEHLCARDAEGPESHEDESAGDSEPPRARVWLVCLKSFQPQA